MQRQAIILTAVCLLCAAAVQAQTFEAGAAYSFTRFSRAALGSVVSGDTAGENTRLKWKQAYGGYFTINTRGYYGHEFSYFRDRAEFSSQVPGEAETDPRIQRNSTVTIHQGAYNFLIYFMPRGERWRPYITGGLEMVHFRKPQIPEWTLEKFRTYGGNYGGGIKLMPVKHVIIRLDVRDHITGKPYDLYFDESGATSANFRSGGLYRRLTASAGISIGF